MKKTVYRRVACILMALLIVCFACFFSCNKEEEQTAEQISIDLSEYKIVRPSGASQTVTDTAVSLRKSLSALGARIDMTDDWYKEGEYDPASKEILFGKTNREESSKALESITDGDAYVISVTENKIVINATKDNLLPDAVSYFLEALVNGSVVFDVDVNYLYCSDIYPVATLVSDNKCNYTIIRGDKSHEYTVDLAGIIRESVISVSNAKNVSFLTDASGDGADELEILIGSTNRAESSEALSGLAYNEYCVKFIGNKIVINAWSLKGVIEGVNTFVEIVKHNVNDDKSVTIPTAEAVTGKLDTAIDGIPVPDGLSLISAYQGREDTYESVYGSADKTAFNAYAAKLVSESYSKYDENVIGENYFATYTKGETAIYISYTPWDATLRVTSETYSALPNVVKESYTKVAESAIAQLSLDGGENFGMCYILTLDDGSYIIIDGGTTHGDAEADIYNYLIENNKRTDGKIVIAAWIFTHEHGDHVLNFIDFTNSYASCVTLESVIWNFTAEYEHDESGLHHSKMVACFSQYKGVKIIKAHAGQRILARNAEMEILTTHENLTPYRLTNMNNSCTVFRINIAGQTILILGDTQTLAEVNSSDKVLMEMYGTELKSDIMHASHHGLGGVSSEFYDLVAPRLCFIPVQKHASDYTSAMASRSTIHLFDMQTAGIIKEILVAEDAGTVTVELPYSK